MRSSKKTLDCGFCEGTVGRLDAEGPSGCVVLEETGVGPEDSNELHTPDVTRITQTNLIVSFAAILYSVGCTAEAVVQDERARRVVQTHSTLPRDRHRRYGSNVGADEYLHLPVE